MAANDQAKRDIHVVVVDDSEFTRRSVVDTLEAAGISVVGEADSAEKAVQLLRATNGNCYIVDIVMPDSSGIDLAKVIADEKKGHLIILMSSLKAENIIIEGITAGASDFLQKPFSKEELLTSVMKAKKELENSDDLSL